MKDRPSASRDRTGSAAAGASMVAAVLASACCILPLVLVILGVSGAWLANLHALQAYQPVFVGIAVGSLGFGFWTVYETRPSNCDSTATCTRPVTDRVVKTVLWIAAALVTLAVSADWWAPLFY